MEHLLQDEDKKQQFEKEKARLEKLYVLPDEPAIVVHPSAVAKTGKFDCAVMSLSVLLDYRPDDNKEHTFEVSIDKWFCSASFSSIVLACPSVAESFCS